MKKTLSIAILSAAVLLIVSSCGSSYKKRKTCRGNGSWYGNRNVSVEPKAEQPQVYRLKEADMTASID